MSSIGRATLDGYADLRPTIPLVILGIAALLVLIGVVLIARSQRPRKRPPAPPNPDDVGRA